MSEGAKVSDSVLAGAVNLRGVRLLMCMADTELKVGEHYTARMDVDFNGHLADRSPTDFTIVISFKVSLEPRGLEPELVAPRVPFRCRVRYELNYAVPADIIENTSDEALEAFAAVNAVFNAWPYLREYVHSTSNRMEMRGVVLPSVRLAELQASVKKGNVPHDHTETP